MDVYEPQGNMEKALQAKADAMNIPLCGALELLPLCNMDCNMCYIRHSVSELEQPLLHASDWLRMMEEARKAGTLYVLLTGGEPLLYPEFKELYLKLQEMGFVLTVNTNGTLFNEEWADFFTSHICKRFNISLYGASNETYARLCHNPQGFTQVMNTLRLLKDRKLPVRLNFTITGENQDDIGKMIKIAKDFDLPFTPVCYTFPPVRKSGNVNISEIRMSPEAAAKARRDTVLLQVPASERSSRARLFLNQLMLPVTPANRTKGFPCHAGLSSYWINWKGNMTACGTMDSLEVDQREKDFQAAWQKISTNAKEIPVHEECFCCGLKLFCTSCPAASMGETGRTDGKPQYLCDMTVSFIRLMIAELPVNEQVFYLSLLNERIPS
ncbi:MAG: radical SAM protein [Lachnospiraceae bacterium]|nr:radical SAM protein [Lachnospiraceae bacterium]